VAAHLSLRPILVRSWVIALAAMLALLPLTALGQQPPIEPPIDPPRCFDCWWPVRPGANLDRLDAAIEVRDGVSETHYVLQLSNNSGGLAEGRIVLPVPPNSSVVDLALDDGERVLEGRVLGADEALSIYEEIVRRLIDPALLRSLGDELYEVRAFPVPAGETREVSFTVVTPLVADGDTALVDVPWSRMSPRPTAAAIAANIDVPWELRGAIAPGFPLDIDRISDGHMQLSWESSAGWRADHDLRLHLQGGDGLLTTRLLTYREATSDGYFALLLAPTLELDRRVDRDLVLVVDTSGSMRGAKIEQARAAASYVLQRLGPRDRFGIVDFARTVRGFDDVLHDADDAAAGLAYIDGLEAAGGTNISGALDRALSLLDGERPGTIIFLTDGLPTAGITDPDSIMRIVEDAAPERTQVFTFGLGFDVDTVLLDELAARLVGTSHYVTPEERVDAEVARLFERISTPVLTDVEITFDGIAVEAVAPATVRGIFVDAQTLVTGRYIGAGDAEVVVRGLTAEGERELIFPVTFPERANLEPAVAQLWAQQRIADLLTEARIEGTSTALIEEIVTIATAFGIVTPYTSYLVEEPQLAAAPRGAFGAVDAQLSSAERDGAAAVGGASAVEALRSGEPSAPPPAALRTAGTQSFVEVDGRWTATGYDDADTTEVLVGSEAFAALVESDPTIAGAAALGPAVVVETAEGWVTIVWPEPDGSAPEVTPIELPGVTGVTATGTTGGGTSSGPPAAEATAETEAPPSAADTDGNGRGLAQPIFIAVAALGAAAAIAVAGLTGMRRRRMALGG
jgi:Ca-activated chloride channel family protein